MWMRRQVQQRLLISQPGHGETRVIKESGEAGQGWEGHPTAWAGSEG